MQSYQHCHCACLPLVIVYISQFSSLKIKLLHMSISVLIYMLLLWLHIGSLFKNQFCWDLLIYSSSWDVSLLAQVLEVTDYLPCYLRDLYEIESVNSTSSTRVVCIFPQLAFGHNLQLAFGPCWYLVAVYCLQLALGSTSLCLLFTVGIWSSEWTITLLWVSSSLFSELFSIPVVTHVVDTVFVLGNFNC